MKISFTPAINNTKAINKTPSQKGITIPNNNVKEIQRNSIAELLGRSQTVSFGAHNAYNGSFLEHSCVEKQGLGKFIKEQILFDRKTGNMTHVITDRYDNLISRDEYYPQKGSQIRTTLDSNGVFTITTITPTTKTVEKSDSENRPFMLAHTDAEGNKRVEMTNYKRGRMVVKETIKGEEQPTKVINLNTGKEVTSGPLVIDRRYDEETDTYITENIVTKDVLKRERLAQNGFVLSQTIYFPETGMVKIQKDYKQEIDSYEIRTYSAREGNPLETLVIESRDKIEKQVITYEEDGKTVQSNILYIKKKNSNELESEVKFKGDTKIIEQRIIYGKAGARTEYYFAEEPNIPRCALQYDKNSNQKSETYFGLDGKTPTLKNEFREDGSIVQSRHNKVGQITETRYYTSNKQIEYLEKFDPESQALISSISFNLENGNRTITIYDTEYETAYKQMVTTKDNVVLSQTIFHPDGETPQYIRRYRKDRSYTITEYDAKGSKIDVKDYNADGTKRTTQKQTANKQTQAIGQDKKTAEKEEEFLRRLTKEINNGNDINKVLSESDWSRLAQIFGVNNSKSIKALTPETCRSLVLKFHPNSANETTKIKHEQLFKIITSLFKGQNSNK